jgi:octaprenyl-diphosphate synthase
MSIESFRKLVQPELDAVDQLILYRAKEKSDLANQIITYIISNGGKRIRPLLVLLCAKACNYQGESHISAAAIIECFHTATLLHDDVVDNSALRRGKPTANTKWGSKASILVGDFLYTLTVKLMTEVNHVKIQNLLAGISHEVTSGELKQLALQYSANPSLEEYLDIIRAKTALLFAASCMIGPLLVGENPAYEEAFFQYGLHLGNAFQLVDDTLDYCSDAEVMGKNTGDDLADGKATLPLLHILKNGTELQKKLVSSSLETGSREHFSEILMAIESTGAIEYTRAAANREKDLAIQAISILHDSPYKTALLDLAAFSLARSY